MPDPRALPINATARQEELLSRLLRQWTCPQALAFRIKIILYASREKTNAAIARELKTTRATVRKWRQRWHATAAKLAITEQEDNPVDMLLTLAQ
jgi:predicted transcriptional regulator